MGEFVGVPLEELVVVGYDGFPLGGLFVGGFDRFRLGELTVGGFVIGLFLHLSECSFRRI